MECTTLLETAEKQFLNGSLSNEDFAFQISSSNCFPQACSQIYGTADFDLAGRGLYYSTLIQVAIFILCGPLQALVSRCLSPHASTSTKLSLARFQSVMDTAYNTGTLLAFGIVIAGFMRTAKYPIAALERSIMRDMTDLHSMLQNLAMATYMTMKVPSNINRGRRAWTSMGVCLCCQILVLATTRLKEKVDEMASMRVIQKLCEKQDVDVGKVYPHLSTSSQASPWWGPALLGVGIAVAMMVMGVLVAVYLPRVWKWIERICTNIVLRTLFAVVWLSVCLLCVGYFTYHLGRTRERLEGTPERDVGQVVLVVLWFPTIAKLFMTVLLTLTVDFGGMDGGKRGYVARFVSFVVRDTYASWFGKEPCIEEDEPKEAKSKDKVDSRSEPSTEPGTTEEKLPLVPLNSKSIETEVERLGRRPSPGAQV